MSQQDLDLDLEELERLHFALNAVRNRRDEVIRRIAARDGGPQAVSGITGYPPAAVAAIAARPQPATGPAKLSVTYIG